MSSTEQKTSGKTHVVVKRAMTTKITSKKDVSVEGLSKAEQRKIRNRLSAVVSRQRRDNALIVLEARVRALEEENRCLKEDLSYYAPQRAFENYSKALPHSFSSHSYTTNLSHLAMC